MLVFQKRIFPCKLISTNLEKLDVISFDLSFSFSFVLGVIIVSAPQRSSLRSKQVIVCREPEIVPDTYTCIAKYYYYFC